MGESNHEIEVKLPFASADEARVRLDAIGARPKRARAFEDNMLFDREVDPLEPGKRMLRLRRTDAGAVLTFKAPVAGEHRHKVRVEHETAVQDGDALERILTGIDFRSAYRYQKYRTELTLEGLHICLDETPIGCFVELEGEPERIDRIAALLGFTPDDYVRESYVELHERDARSRGVPLADMVFPPEAHVE